MKAAIGINGFRQRILLSRMAALLDAFEFVFDEVEITLGGAQVLVTEHGLDVAEVGSAF